MRKLTLIPILIVLLAVPMAVLAGSGETGFDAVVDSIQSRYHVRAMRIPFMGLISMVAGKATHKGVTGLHVAEFESFTEPVDGEELNRMVEEKLGPGWERIIRETGRQGDQQTLIFMHPEGQKMGLFVVDRNGSEMDVVQVSVDPAHIDDDIGQYSHHHHGKPDAPDPDKTTSD